MPQKPKRPRWPFFLVAAAGLVLLLAIGAVVLWYHFKNHQPVITGTVHQPTSSQSSSGNPAPATGNVFVSPDKIFTVNYPFGWTNNGPWQQPCGTVACVGRAAFTPLDAIAQYSAKYGNSNLLLAYATEVKTDLTPQQWFAQAIAPPASDDTQTNTTSINGYATYYVRVVDANYTDDHYVIAHGGTLVDISMREIVTTFQPKPPHSSTPPKIADQQNYSRYVAAYAQMAQSIAFHN